MSQKKESVEAFLESYWEVPGRDFCFKAFSRGLVFSCMNTGFFVELATNISGSSFALVIFL